MTANNEIIGDRRRVLKSGQLVLNNRQSVIDCVVRSIGATGADVRLDGIMTVPEQILLKFEDRLIPSRCLSQQGVNVKLEFI